MSLRNELIKLANEKPALRPLLLPILKRAHRGGVWVGLKELPGFMQKALASFNYRRPNIEVVESKEYSPSEGSAAFTGNRGFVIAVDLVSGRVKAEEGSYGGDNAYESKQVDVDRKKYPIPPNSAVIIGESGGRGAFAHIKVHPAAMPKMLPAAEGDEVSEDEKKVLSVMKSIKGGYRGEWFARHGLGGYSAANPLMQSLAKKGMIQINRAGAAKITTKGLNALGNFRID